MYDAVLFDNDGVLVKPMEIEPIYDAIRDTFAEFGVEPSERDVRRLVGVSPDELRGICDKYCIGTSAFWERRDANVSRVQREAVDAGEKEPYDDISVAERLAREHGIPVGVVSNNQHATVEHIVSKLELSFLETYSGREPTLDDLRRKKPSPHFVEEALETVGTRNAVYVGDSTKDIVASERAGIDSALVRRDHVEVNGAEPTHEVESLHELLAMMEDDG